MTCRQSWGDDVRGSSAMVSSELPASGVVEAEREERMFYPC
jgi:hypothetical protein